MVTKIIVHSCVKVSIIIYFQARQAYFTGSQSRRQRQSSVQTLENEYFPKTDFTTFDESASESTIIGKSEKVYSSTQYNTVQYF